MDSKSFNFNAQLVARYEAMRDHPDAALRAIATMLTLAQCLASTQSVTAVVRHPDLRGSGNVLLALKLAQLDEFVESYEEAVKHAPPVRIHVDEVDTRKWPGRDRYMAVRSTFEASSGLINQKLEEMAKAHWAAIEQLPPDPLVLDHYKQLAKKLRRSSL